jgi:hypothetical protein
MQNDTTHLLETKETGRRKSFKQLLGYVAGGLALTGILPKQGVSETRSKSQTPIAVGEIRMFSGSTAPDGWLPCEGQSLPVKNHASLFAMLGTTYGGDGIKTFRLPDMRERVILLTGQGKGITNRNLGSEGGVLENNPPGVQYCIAVG